MIRMKRTEAHAWAAVTGPASSGGRRRPGVRSRVVAGSLVVLLLAALGGYCYQRTGESRSVQAAAPDRPASPALHPATVLPLSPSSRASRKVTSPHQEDPVTEAAASARIEMPENTAVWRMRHNAGGRCVGVLGSSGLVESGCAQAVGVWFEKVSPVGEPAVWQLHVVQAANGCAGLRTGASVKSGGEVVVGACDRSSDGQRWSLEKLSDDQGLTVVNRMHLSADATVCLTAASDRLILGACGAGDQPIWTFLRQE
jgi:hypothetical protein